MTWTTARVAGGVRVLALVLCLLTASLYREPTAALKWFPLLVLAAIVGSQRQDTPVVGRLLRIAEAMIAAVAIAKTSQLGVPLVPYLVAPTFAGGLMTGPAGAVISPGFAMITLLAVVPLVPHSPDSFAILAQWSLLAVATGLVGAWVRRLQLFADGEEVNASYAAAYRLLGQLRPVARQLSAGLDPSTLATGLLETLREHWQFDRGAVLIRSGAGRLVPLSVLGSTTVNWPMDLAADGPFAEAWSGQEPQVRSHQLSGPPGSALVVPLVVGPRTFGLVAMETRHRDLAATDARSVADIVNHTALRLETALLFDEVRTVATAEERRRMAREIHDGIAQDLSSLGYLVDATAAKAKKRGDAVEGIDDLRRLRGEISRIVKDLRLSIFDLRTGVDADAGLGASLADYVRTVGRQSGIVVHLSLAESAVRLPAETEAELLRIAQEAIANVRRDAVAENLWVTLSVDPPAAVLRIEDDGATLGRGRADRRVIERRGRRLGAFTEIRPRMPSGTIVEIAVRGREEQLIDITDGTHAVATEGVTA